MTGTIEVPVWLAVLTGALAILAVVRLLLLPGLKRLMERRKTRAVDQINVRLRLGVPSFLMTKRDVIINRLMFDEAVQQLVTETAEETGETRQALMARVKKHAEDIVPAFSIFFYFRLGYWLARWVLRLHYVVRTAYVDDTAFDAIGPDSTVVMILNHRSNMDVLLVNYLASRRSTLSYAAGEWARLWPFYHIQRAAGNYVVDRDARDVLYRRVLERYVTTATSAGVHQGIFPEGELSRDAAMHSPKLGLISYITKAFDPNGKRDIIFIPVAINYDRVPEDRRLVYEQDTEFRERGKAFLVRSSFRYALEVAALPLRRREDRFGYACASFGHPISWREWLEQQHVDPHSLDRKERYECVSALTEKLMLDIGGMIPVLPVPVVAAALVSDPRRAWSVPELKSLAHKKLEDLMTSGAQVYLPDGDEDAAITAALEMLVRRKLVDRNDAGRYSIAPAELPLVHYYANSITHLFAKADHAVPA